MKKLAIGILIFIFTNYSFSNDLISHIESAIHGQTYCIKGDESKEIKEFLKNHAKYAYNECKHNKTTKKDFDKLVKLARKNPKKYGFYLGMAYFLGFTTSDKENNDKAALWLEKSAKLGNKNSEFRYCDTIDDAKLAFKCYQKADTPKSQMAKASLFRSFEKQCSYIQRIDYNKYLDSYPFIINCESALNESFTYNKLVIKNLERVLFDKTTTFGSKLTSAGMLQNEKYINLLSGLYSNDD